MVGNRWSRCVTPMLCFAGACSSAAPAASSPGGSPEPTQGSAQDAAGQGQAEAAPPPAEANAAGPDTGTPEAAVPVDTGSGASVASVDASATGDAALPGDASPPAEASRPDDAGRLGDTNTAPNVASGQYSLTLNATTPYMLGAEHLGKTVYGIVLDTTAGANMAQVGAILSTPVTPGQQVKWVWPDILVAGHTYVLGMFCDDAKNMTCVPNTDAGWIFQIAPPPGGGTKAVPVTGDVVIPWTTPVPRSDATKCQYFPTTAITDATAVPPP